MKTIGDVHIDVLVILSFLQFSDVHVDSSPIEALRANALHDFFPPNADNCGQVRQHTRGRVLWRTPGWRFRHARILERRVSLMLITMLVAAVGVNRTLLQRLGGRAFALV